MSSKPLRSGNSSPNKCDLTNVNIYNEKKIVI